MRNVDPAKHKQKKSEILAAAARCFRRAGFQGTSLAQICKEAKMSGGHVYHYFKTKEDIIAGMAELRLESQGARFKQLMNAANPLAAFLAEIDPCTTPKPSEPGPGLFLDLLQEARTNERVAKILRAHSAQERRMLEQVISRGQARGQINPALNPKLAAQLLMSIGDGLRLMSIRSPGFNKIENSQLLKVLIKRFLEIPPQGKTG